MLLDEDWAHRALINDVGAGLTRVPRTLPPRWLYDEYGSQLFDQITRLPTYYPTESERSILTRVAEQIVELSGADVLVELGSGTSDKTRSILDAFSDRRSLNEFIALDVSEQTLRDAALMLSERYPRAAITGVVGDFTVHLQQLPRRGRRLVMFLGGTIGNFTEVERAQFLIELAATLEPGEMVLLGTDLVKSADRLIAAYDDAEGVTEEFIRNSLTVVNREAGADFDQAQFEYVCFWDPTRERVDMRLRSLSPHTVTASGAGVTIVLAEGEEIQIELSTKFREERLIDDMSRAGLSRVAWWTDDDGDFAVSLWRREG